MAKLSSNLLPQIKSAGLARVTKAGSVVEAVATVASRVRALTLITAQHVIDRTAVAGVVLSGLATAKELRGKDETGKPHVTVRSNFALCTSSEIEAFIASLSTIPTIEGVQQAYYSFIDEVVVNGTIWEGESLFAIRTSVQGTLAGFLRADPETGDVSISGLVAEKPTTVLQAKKLPSLNASIPVAPVAGTVPQAPGAPTPPTPSAPQAPVMKVLNGTAYSQSDLLNSGWAQTQIDALPNA